MTSSDGHLRASRGETEKRRKNKRPLHPFPARAESSLPQHDRRCVPLSTFNDLPTSSSSSSSARLCAGARGRVRSQTRTTGEEGLSPTHGAEHCASIRGGTRSRRPAPPRCVGARSGQSSNLPGVVTSLPGRGGSPPPIPLTLSVHLL